MWSCDVTVYVGLVIPISDSSLMADVVCASCEAVCLWGVCSRLLYSKGWSGTDGVKLVSSYEASLKVVREDFVCTVVVPKVSLTMAIVLWLTEEVTSSVGGACSEGSDVYSTSCYWFGAPRRGETSDREVLIGGHSS